MAEVVAASLIGVLCLIAVVASAVAARHSNESKENR